MSPSCLPVRSMTESFAMVTSGLDLDVDTGRQVELHQRVERLLVRLEDVEQPLVRADLELLARLLVDERPTENRVLVDLGRQRDRTRDRRTGAPRGVGDLARRLIEQLVVVGLEPDADLEVLHRSLRER